MKNITFSGIFSDDVRHEVGGKRSLMGVYGTHLLVEKFPVQLRSLCFTFDLRIPVELADKVRTATLIITSNDKDFVKLSADLNLNPDDDRVPYCTFSGGMELPIGEDIKETTTLVTMMQVDEEIFEGPYLVMDSQTANALA